VTRLSLRLRLALAGAIAVSVALVLTAFGLSALFATHVERRALSELSVHLDQLLAGLARADGALVLATRPADPRFRRPYGGLYWQIEAGDTLLRSRSLWDHVLSLPQDELTDGQVHRHDLIGPNRTRLLVLERSVTLPRRLGGDEVRVAVALQRADLDAARTAFATDMAPYLGLLAATLILAGWVQVAVGLRPFRAIGAHIAALRAGRAERMGSDWPKEVRPLAAELDALLAAREADIVRARARAGDLAHGLKTPLQALMGEANRLRARGNSQAAEGIEDVAEAMRRHIDRELARARTAARARHAEADPAQVANRVAAVLRRTPSGARLSWTLDLAEGLTAAIDPDDLAEALGALAENAVRHAASAVTLTARARENWLHLIVDDDGPGIPEALRTALTRRGARLDESVPGTGLGLAIAAEIAEAAGGSLELETRNPGLAARLTLPRRHGS